MPYILLKVYDFAKKIDLHLAKHKTTCYYYIQREQRKPLVDERKEQKMIELETIRAGIETIRIRAHVTLTWKNAYQKLVSIATEKIIGSYWMNTEIGL